MGILDRLKPVLIDVAEYAVNTAIEYVGGAVDSFIELSKEVITGFSYDYSRHKWVLSEAKLMYLDEHPDEKDEWLDKLEERNEIKNQVTDESWELEQKWLHEKNDTLIFSYNELKKQWELNKDIKRFIEFNPELQTTWLNYLNIKIEKESGLKKDFSDDINIDLIEENILCSADDFLEDSINENQKNSDDESFFSENFSEKEIKKMITIAEDPIFIDKAYMCILTPLEGITWSSEKNKWVLMDEIFYALHFIAANPPNKIARKTGVTGKSTLENRKKWIIENAEDKYLKKLEPSEITQIYINAIGTLIKTTDENAFTFNATTNQWEFTNDIKSALEIWPPLQNYLNERLNNWNKVKSKISD